MAVQRGDQARASYAALDHRFRFVTNDARLAAHVATLLTSLRSDQDAEAAYTLERRADGFGLRYGDEELATGVTAAHAVAMLIWDVNRRAVAASVDHVLLHAAAAERGGRAIVLPAPMESGKTTLVAGLARAGLRYLTDEIVALDPLSLSIRGYPKPLSVDPGSWEVLRDLDPRLDAHADLHEMQWHVPPARFSEDVRSTSRGASTARPAVIIFPRYDPGESSLEEIEPDEALVELAGCTFDFERDAERNLAVLARLSASAPAYRLVVGDLEPACALALGALREP